LLVSNGFGGEAVMCERDGITFADIRHDLTMDSGRRVPSVVTSGVGESISGQEKQPKKERPERRENDLETL